MIMNIFKQAYRRFQAFPRKILLGLIFVASSFAHGLELQVYLWPVEGLLGADSEIRTVPNLYLREGESFRRVAAGRGTTGPVVQTEVRGNLELYLRDPDGGGHRLFAAAQVPAGWSRVVMLVFPERRLEEDRVEAMVIHFDPARVRPGQALITNYSPHPLRLVINQQQVHDLPVGGVLALTRAQVEQRRVGDDSRFEMQLYLQDGQQQWRAGYQGVQYLRPDTPNLFLVSPGPHPLQVRLRALRPSD